MVSELSQNAIPSLMADPLKPPISFKHILSIKLNEENHLLWKQQVLAAIRGHNLLHFLESTSNPHHLNPSSTESSYNDAEIVHWEQQDQLLVSWLLSSMSESILTRMVGCETAAQIWTRLNHFFATQTRAKISQFKLMLQGTKKGSSSINEYLLKIKNVIDRLASVGHPVSSSYHIDAILNGLPEEYDTFVISINSRSESYVVEEIEALLLAQEGRIEKHSKELDSYSSLANLTTQQTTRRYNRGGNYHPRPHNYSSQPQYTRSNNSINRGKQYTSGKSYGGRNNSQGYKVNWNSGNTLKPQCQVCGKTGHTALTCWHRFDQEFTSDSSSSHTNQSPISAMAATSCTAFDPQWYPDSGATDHITPDENNLVHKAPYTGHNQVHVGDGKGLTINHVGSSTFYSQFSSKPLTLKHLLHVPSMTKNLLSVSKFSSDNSVFFEFFPNHCFVKDQVNHKVLMEGKLKQGLYVFNPPKLLLPAVSPLP